MSHELERSTDPYRATFEAAPVGICHVGAGGRFLRVNPAFCQIVGRPEEEVLQLGVPDITFPGDPDTNSPVIQELMSGERDRVSLRKRLVRPDGEPRWVELTASSVRSEAGEPKFLIAVLDDIQAQVEAEEVQAAAAAALRQRERELDLAQQVANMGSWVLDLEQDSLSWSDQTYRLFGVAPGQPLSYADFLDRVHPEDRSMVDEAWSKALRGERYDIEHRVVVDGETLWVHERAELETDADGQPVRGIGTVLDITERKQAGLALESSEARLRSIGEAIPDLIFVLDEDGRYVEILTADEQLLVRGAEELRGRNLTEVFEPPQAERFLSLIRRTVESGESQVLEYTIEVPAGRMDFEGRTSPLRGEIDGKRAVVMVARDISERKRSEEQYRSIVETSIDGFWIVDRRGQIIDVNPAYAEMIGYSEAELLKMGVPDIEAVESDDEVADRIRRIERDGYDRFETRHQHKDGHLVDVEVSVQFSDIRGGCFLVFLRDASNRKRIEAELKQHQENLQELVEERTEGLERINLALSSSEREFRQLLENLEAGVVVHAPDTSIQLFNRRATEILGLSPDEMIGKKAVDPTWCFQREDGERMPLEEYPVNLVLSRREVLRGQIVGVRHPGDRPVTWVYVNAFPEFSEHGELRRVAVTFIDITARKNSEIEHGRDEERLTSLLYLAEQESAGADDLERIAVEEVLKLTGSEIGYLHYFDQDGQFIRLNCWSQQALRYCTAPQDMHYPLEQAGVWADSVRTGEPAVHNDFGEAIGNGNMPEGHVEVRRHMSVPILDGNRAVGVLGVGNKEEPYDQSDIRQLQLFLNSMWPQVRKWEFEDALRRSEDKYRRLVTEINDGFFVTDEEGRLSFLNAEMARILGGTVEGLGGVLLFDRLRFGGDHGDQAAILAQLSRGETPDELEAVVRNGSDHPTQVSLKSVPVMEDGRMTGLRGVVRDITQRKRQEVELRKLFEATEQSPASVIITDPNGVIEYVNSKFVEVTGYSLEEAIGRTPRILKSGRMPDSVYHDLWSTIQAGEAWHGELLNRRKDGSTYWERASISPIRDEQGQVTHFLAVKEDITELKEWEQELQRAKERAEQASVAKSVFLANMSHEIRTPMNAIIGYTQLLHRSQGLNQTQVDYLDTINRSGEHLLALINDILEMSKIEAGRTRLEVAPFDLHGVVEDLQRMFRLRAEEKGLELDVRLADGLPRFVNGDANKVRQVLINILGNAVKFTEDGGISVRGRVSDQSGGRLLQFDVEDSGCGIAPADLPNVFNVFERAAAGRTESGTGLGMPISRKFARMMGGDVTVISLLGKGSRFRFEFAAEACEEEQVPDRRPRRVVAGLEPGQAPPRVLVVDDNADNRAVLHDMLMRVGFSVHEAVDGVDALVQFQAWEPDIILMDLKMPGMNGFETTRRIRAGGSRSETPILAVTASALEASQERAAEAGVDGFLAKPFSEDTLLEEIHRLTGVRYLYQEESGAASEAMDPFPAEAVSLRGLPAEMRRSIRVAVEGGYLDELHALVRRVADTDEHLARVLRSLVDDFRYDDLLRLTEEEDRHE